MEIPGKSVKQVSLWWGSVFRQYPFCRQGFLFLRQMRQYGLDHHRVFNAGNDVELTSAVLAGGHIDIEDPLEVLRPGHGSPRFGGLLAGFGGDLDLVALAAIAKSLHLANQLPQLTQLRLVILN